MHMSDDDVKCVLDIEISTYSADFESTLMPLLFSNNRVLQWMSREICGKSLDDIEDDDDMSVCANER